MINVFLTEGKWIESKPWLLSAKFSKFWRISREKRDGKSICLCDSWWRRRGWVCSSWIHKERHFSWWTLHNLWGASEFLSSFWPYWVHFFSGCTAVFVFHSDSALTSSFGFCQLAFLRLGFVKDFIDGGFIEYEFYIMQKFYYLSYAELGLRDIRIPFAFLLFARVARQRSLFKHLMPFLVWWDARINSQWYQPLYERELVLKLSPVENIEFPLWLTILPMKRV